MGIETATLHPPAAITPAARDRRVVYLESGGEDTRVHRGILQAAREVGWNLIETPERPDGRGWLLRCRGHEIELLTQATSAHPQPGRVTLELAHAAAGALAARHLLALDFPHIAFYRGRLPAASERLMQAFSNECQEAGKPAVELAAADLTAALRSLPFPCALFAATDEDAAAVIAAAREMEIAVPSQLAVLGCGNREKSVDGRPSKLSSIDMNHETAGYLAARMFDRMISGEALPKNRWTVRLKGVIDRESTCRFPSDHPGVAHALRRIRRDYAEPLTVPLLAREAGMSVRTLQRFYSGITGSVISEDLLNQRLEAAAGLLRNSGLKLEAIASAVGLGNANRLCRLFRLRFGRTPNQYRTPAREHRHPSLSEQNSPMLSQ